MLKATATKILTPAAVRFAFGLSGSSSIEWLCKCLSMTHIWAADDEKNSGLVISSSEHIYRKWKSTKGLKRDLRTLKKPFRYYRALIWILIEWKSFCKSIWIMKGKMEHGFFTVAAKILKGSKRNIYSMEVLLKVSMRAKLDPSYLQKPLKY